MDYITRHMVEKRTYIVYQEMRTLPATTKTKLTILYNNCAHARISANLKKTNLHSSRVCATVLLGHMSLILCLVSNCVK